MPIPSREARLIEQAQAWRERAIEAELLNLKLKQALVDLDVRQQMYRKSKVVDAASVERP
jgi:hypothetical protein